jgi:hypothetical protein
VFIEVFARILSTVSYGKAHKPFRQTSDGSWYDCFSTFILIDTKTIQREVFKMNKLCCLSLTCISQSHRG